jgi:hypothetical protein
MAVNLNLSGGCKHDFSLISLKKGHTLEKSLFFEAHFSCKRDEQPSFKFDIDLEVRFVYRLIPKKPAFLG